MTAVVCRDFVELVTEYLEGALPAADVAAVDAHLADCAACRRYLDQMRSTLHALGFVPVATLPKEVLDVLRAAFTGRGEPDGGAG